MPYSSDVCYLLRQAGIDIHARSSTSPISLRRLCTHMGLKYKKIPLDHNTCGMLIRSVKGIFIVINADHNYTRRRFSNAHEFGHWFFGHDSDVSKDNDQNRHEEVQANKFASCLLMPEELFHYVHKEQSTIKDMANWLRVSPISVAIRCGQFGLRKLESELVRNEYFQFSEIAAASSRMNATIKPQQNIGLKAPSPSPITARSIIHDQRLRKQNEEMLDKLRRSYGYE